MFYSASMNALDDDSLTAGVVALLADHVTVLPDSVSDRRGDP